MPLTTTSNILIILSLVGLLLSSYIYYKKTRKEKLVCLIGKDCDKVIRSKYANSLLMPNDVIGIIYYAIILISTLIFIQYPLLLISSVILIRAIMVAVAAIFSIYLTLIQLFILKELCEYCLVANLINVLIFIALFF